MVGLQPNCNQTICKTMVFIFVSWQPVWYFVVMGKVDNMDVFKRDAMFIFKNESIMEIVLCLILVGSLLHGCGGCDKDKVSTCSSTPIGKAQQMCDDFAKCLGDAGCCDHEEGGVKLSGSMKTTCEGQGLTFSCTNA